MVQRHAGHPEGARQVHDAQTSLADSVDPARTAVEIAATSSAGAAVARLLASTVDVVTDFEPIHDEPAVLQVVREAARALDALCGRRYPGEVIDALEAIGVVVAALPLGNLKVTAGAEGER